jgi:hypothetical protein
MTMTIANQRIRRRIRQYILGREDASGTRDLVRITKNGEVHCRTSRHGWVFAGFVENIADEIAQRDRDRAYFEDEANRDKVLLGRHH